MLDRLAEIAPLGTWALVLLASVLLLCGFVTYGHARLAEKAYGQEFRGPLATEVRASMYRWTAALMAGGIALWGAALGWPGALPGALGAVAAAALGLEVAARVRG